MSKENPRPAEINKSSGLRTRCEDFDHVEFCLKITYLLSDSSARPCQQLHSTMLADVYLPTVNGLAINLLNNTTNNFVSSDPNLPKWRTGNLYNRETG